MNDLTFEQAALLSRWLSGDRENIEADELTQHWTTRQLGRWIWARAKDWPLGVWVPASLENEHAQANL